MTRSKPRTAVLACVLAVAVGATTAQAGEGVRAGQEATMGVATIAANIVYIPVKLVYAGVGAATGTLAYMLTLGSRQTANDIWVPSLGGDYVLTGDMVSGRQPFYFKGRREPREF